MRDPEVIERAAQETRDNHLALRGAGLRAIPVLHQGEEIKWLEAMLKDDEPTIALSPAKRAHGKEIKRWLSKIFPLIPRKTEVHALGLTETSLIWDFAWTSVDSASWVHAARNGCILVPRYAAPMISRTSGCGRPASRSPIGYLPRPGDAISSA